jgi:cytochrome c peroxidase
MPTSHTARACTAVLAVAMAIALTVPASTAAPTETPMDSDGARVRLGQTLFFDKQLSSDGSTSCGSCHDPARYFTDGLPRSRGFRGHVGNRNAPSLIDVALNDSQFWDGRADRLESQAAEPFFNPREMGATSKEQIERRIEDRPLYLAAFKVAFPKTDRAITFDHAIQAIVAFERTLHLDDSPFDRYRHGEKSALSASAARGYGLFAGAARCSTCHRVSEHVATFTDGDFHALIGGLKGVSRRLATLTMQVAKLRGEGRSPGQVLDVDDDMAALGRFVVTLQPRDLGAFRTPSLRNVAQTAPYMHDGSVDTLAEAVDQEVYYRTTQDGHPLLLNADERTDLVAFLESLTSPASGLNRFVDAADLPRQER